MDRFIALAIRLVRIVPDAPTIMPATIIAVLFSARPAAAADNPVSALSSEMTTGMSAPPIGSTTIRPSTAGEHQHADDHQLRIAVLDARSPMYDRGRDARRAAARVERLLEPWPSADRLAAAASLLQLAERDQRAPERHRADDRREQRADDDVHDRARRRCARSRGSRWNSDHAISATVPPPTPLNSATSCGIAVILVFFAGGTPSDHADDQTGDDQDPVARCRGRDQRRDDRDAPCRRAAIRLPRTAVLGRSGPSGRR